MINENCSHKYKNIKKKKKTENVNDMIMEIYLN